MAKTTKYFRNAQQLATWLDGEMLPSGVLAVVLNETGDDIDEIQVSTNGVTKHFEKYVTVGDQMAERLQEELEEANATIATQETTIATLNETIAVKDETIATQSATIAQKDAIIAERDATIQTQSATITSQASEIQTLTTQLATANETIQDLQSQVQTANATITSLQNDITSYDNQLQQI